MLQIGRHGVFGYRPCLVHQHTLTATLCHARVTDGSEEGRFGP